MQPALEKAFSGAAATFQNLRHSLEQESSKLSVLVEQELEVRALVGHTICHNGVQMSWQRV
jgi:hypothetical protein